ncbi:MAG: alpha-hydroxy-acid oxidizing protein, partial [Bdellovibrionales bacterium]|nr:alpha-hydroxy-acid oxidizing protein [Bdellovibrionales bacterium]
MDRRRFIERLIAFQLGIPLTGCANLFENQDRSGGSLPKSKSLTGKEEHLLNLIDSCSDRPTLLDPIIKTPEEAFNTFQFEWAAKKKLDPAAFLYLACGAEDNLTLRANRRVFEDTQIKVRRFQNVSKVDTKTSIFGAKYPSPLFICPCGLQTAFHPESEVPVAKSAQDSGYLMMLSTVATKTYEEVKEQYRGG